MNISRNNINSNKNDIKDINFINDISKMSKLPDIFNNFCKISIYIVYISIYILLYKLFI